MVYAIPAVSLVNREWYMRSYTIDHKCGSRYASTKTAGDLEYCNSSDVFNKTIISLALVELDMISLKPSLCYAPRWLSTTSYPTRARGIIVKYPTSHLYFLGIHTSL